jgi:hypothetical protein
MAEKFELGDIALGQNPNALYVNGVRRVGFVTREAAEEAYIRYNDMAVKQEEIATIKSNINAADQFLKNTDYVELKKLRHDSGIVVLSDDELAAVMATIENRIKAIKYIQDARPQLPVEPFAQSATAVPAFLNA